LYILFTVEPTLPVFRTTRIMAPRDGMPARHVLRSGA
jgi:hypothetical protein